MVIGLTSAHKIKTNKTTKNNMKTFTTYAEKKAKQFLNLLQGYTRGIRITAILILLLMGVSNVWAARTFKSGEKIYFKDAKDKNLNNSTWKVSDGNIYAYFWNNSENAWSSYGNLVSGSWNAENAIYEFTVPGSGKTYTKMLFTRGKAANWNNTWNQTGDQTPNDGQNIFYISSGTWGAYAKNGAIVGSMNNWNPDSNPLSSNKVTISLNYTSATNYDFKVLYGETYYGTTNAISKTVSNQAFSTSGDNCLLNLVVASGAKDYTFTWDNSGKKLSVTYPTSYTITYSQNPSSAANAPTTSPSVTSGGAVASGTSVKFTAQAAKTGYTWKGWYDNNAGTGNALSTNLAYTPSITANTTIYAVYTLDTYTITYILNDGSGTMTPTDYNVTTATFNLPTPTRTGYTFAGWYDNVDLKGNKVTQITKGSTGNKTFYAKWTLDNYTITYNTNGGSGTMTPTSYTIETATFNLPTPTKTGYNFAGWYTKNDFSDTKVTQIEKGTTGDKTFYAKWTENTYTVTINNDGHGTTTPSGAQSNVGQVTGVGISATANNGYQFENWTITSGSGSFTSTTATTTTFKPTAASTIQANFSPIEYTITYEQLNGVTHDNPPTYTIEDTPLTFTNPTSERTGYTFNGWNPASIAQGSTEDKTVTAQWTAKTYTVTFNQNWATTNGATSVIATYDSPLPSIADNLPTKTGYRFEGYWDGENGTGKQYYKADGTSFRNWDKTSSCTLFAKWEQEIYTITLDNQGGDETTEVTTTYGAILPPVTPPTKIGYVFKGYNEKADGTGLMWYPETGICELVWNKTSDATLYAQWEERKLWINGNIATDQPMIHDINNPGVYTYTTNAVNKTEGSSYYHFKFYKTEKGIEENMAYGWSTIQKPLSTNNEDVVTKIGQDPGWSTNISFSLTRKSDITITLTLQDAVDATYPTVRIEADPYYTITWKDENDNIVKEQELHAGETITPPDDPSREGYTFAGWGSPQTMPAADVTYIAQWTINQYTITYGVVGSAHGTIQLNTDDPVTTSASATADYDTRHTLTAKPANDYKIGGWYSDANGANKIDGAGTNDTYEIASLTANTDVYVRFVEAAEVMSQVTVEATAGGTVSQIGIVEVGNRTPTTFTATPAPGYRFDHWQKSKNIVEVSKSETNEQGRIDITANGTGTLTAHFTRVHTVNFYATPAVAGSVAATVGGNTITSGDKLDDKTSVTFTADVANAYDGQCTFVKWVDGAGTQLSNASRYQHTVTEDITVKAIFKIKQYTLTFSAGEGGHVSAIANHSAIASPANLDYNTSVTLTAEPDAGCAFVKWVDSADNLLSNDATYTINKMDGNKIVQAVFAQGTTVYLKPVDWWKNDKARFAVYMWNNSENEWIEMEDLGCNGDIYTANIPSKYTSFMFVRLKPVTHADYNTENGGYNFENAWNQTGNLTIPTDNKNMYDMTISKTTHVYLKPNGNWKTAGRLAAYFYNSTGNTWKNMTDPDGDGVYSCERPSGYTDVVFCRMNNNTYENKWENRWDQTNDLKLLNDDNCFTIDEGQWGSNGNDNSGATGSWSKHWDDCQWTTYSAPSYKIKINTPTNGTIAVTTADGSAVANNTSLALGTEIKIVFTPNSSYELINYFIEYATATDKADVYTVCGPTEITAEFELETPSRTVYLRPNDDWMKDNPVFAARVRKSSGGNDKWYVMHTTSEDYTGSYSCNIPNDYDKIIFVRLNPKGSATDNDGFNWDNAWNQTKELTIIDKDNDKTNDHKLRFAIGDKIVGGNDNDRYDGKWEENTPIWGLATNFNDWKAEKAVFKGYPGKLDVAPPFGTSHEFKLYNFFGIEASNNLWHGNSGTMKRANSGQWWTMEGTQGANCKMMLDVSGEYIYQMRFLTIGTDLKKQVSVTYPEADMYYVMYEETTSEGTKQRISYGIRLTGEERLDTVSFFVDIAKSAKIYILNSNREKVGDYYTIIGTGGENQGGAMAPKRRAAAEEDPTLRVEQGCGIEESGVYNFVAQQDAEGKVTLLINDWHAYTGAYYIRTDAANGGWGGYKQNGNKMTYTSYADKNHNFDHYYCKWITSSESSYANVKFCVANDYSHQLSDELDGDEIIEKALVPTGCLPANANVRFGWDSKTNELTRAYISGSSNAADRFLVLTGNDYLLDINGNKLKVDGLYDNEAIFGDQGNWVYQLDVQANTQTAIKLTAEFNDRVQTFFGDARAAADGEEVMAATTPEYHKVRMIYNFKTNHLLAAWLLDHPNQDINNGEVNANVLIIRENHGDANQLQFNNNLTEMTVNTAYAVMTFTENHVTNNSLTNFARYEYWVSFPFDVKISDVFGFGEYGDTWIMQLYDGAGRAEKGYWADSPTFWKYITNKNYTLKAGVGYVLKLDKGQMATKKKGAWTHTDAVSLYFPSTPNDAGNTIISATPDTQHEIPSHECTIQREKRYIYDSHWNLIGVPGYANIKDFNTAATLSPVKYEAGQVSFYYEYLSADNSYQATSAKSDFKNMHSYMVQFAGTINWSTPDTPTKLAARRNSDYAEPEKVSFRLELAQGEEKADQTFVQLQQEGATPDFDMNLDLTKIINSGANIYTLAGESRIQSAGNALPMGEAVVVPVGVKIDAEGEYTFRMPDGTEGMVVELVDYETNTRTNLLLSDYTVTLAEGTSENRFALHIQPQKDVVTSLENIGEGVNNGEAVNKYLIDGKLIIRTAEGIFDAQGHRL